MAQISLVHARLDMSCILSKCDSSNHRYDPSERQNLNTFANADCTQDKSHLQGLHSMIIFLLLIYLEANAGFISKECL